MHMRRDAVLCCVVLCRVVLCCVVSCRVVSYRRVSCFLYAHAPCSLLHASVSGRDVKHFNLFTLATISDDWVQLYHKYLHPRVLNKRTRLLLF